MLFDSKDTMLIFSDANLRKYCNSLVSMSSINSLTFPVSAEGNSDSNLLLSPNLKMKGEKYAVTHK